MAATGTNKKITLTELQSAPVSAGTANGVLYLNGSKVATSGSALYFNGTNFGINTSSPTQRLDVNGNIRTTGEVALSGSDFVYSWAGGTTGQRRSGFYLDGVSNVLRMYTNNSEVARIDSSGNLGIGTTSPSNYTNFKTLEIGAGGGTKGGLLRISGASNTVIGYFYADSLAPLLTIGSDTSTALSFVTGATERARIDSSGNLGLGVTPSAWNTSLKALQISGVGGTYSSGNGEIGITQNAYYATVNAWIYGSTAAASAYQLVGGVHKWLTAASGTAGNAITFTQAMTLDSSGNLGIGVTSVASKLHVKVTGGSDDTLFSFGANQDNFITAGSSGVTIFRNLGTERARIDSSGSWLVGTTSTVGSAKFYVLGSVGNFISRIRNSDANPSGLEVSYTAATINGTGNDFLYCADATALRAEIRSNGGLANYQANNVNLSDRREKTNFAPAKAYLDTICAIPVQTFNYIDQNNEEDPGLTLGVVAQDVQAVAPELVMESNWGTEDNPKMRLSIYQTDLQYALMKAIQELKAEFDAYKASHP
jgi:hypothetical protein